jgi:asparaginyl-tRNA synthetase
MKRTLIKFALLSEAKKDEIIVKGWVRTRRDYKGFSFIELNDGSCLKNIQIVIDHDVMDLDTLATIMTGASLGVKGQLAPSQGKGQKWEIKAQNVEIYGLADGSYPLQKKGHSREFLREIAHLRPRSNLFGCVFRVRNRLSYAIHTFFQNKNFVYIHTPIITGSDCEGAGELFRVTTFDLNNVPKNNGEINFKEDFFGKPTYLTVSGQLEGELFATALSNIYTFGPTFRAENSNTARHASEFWMIEPEMAFCDLDENMDMAEEFIKYLIQDLLSTQSDEIELFNRFVDKDLKHRLNFTLEKTFQKLSYTEAVDILQKSHKDFEFPVSYGMNLQTEHERFLTEEHFKCPVTVYNYPKDIKPFYMRLNDDNKTVTAMDVLVPGIGEIIGGSQREERLEILLKQIENHGLSKEDYAWYVDTRKFGTVPHSGFGLGFERMLMFVTGLSNIRDVIPFARTPKNAEF